MTETIWPTAVSRLNQNNHDGHYSGKTSRPPGFVSALRQGLQTRLPTGKLALVTAAMLAAGATNVAAEKLGQFELKGDQERGKAPYLDQCATCHGASGRGDGPEGAAFDSRPSDLTRQDLSAERMFIATRDGGMAVGLRATMPAFRYTFDDETIHDIVAYVLTLRD